MITVLSIMAVLLVLLPAPFARAQILAFVDSARIDGATIWGVPVEHPSGWGLTAMRGPRLYLHRMGDDLTVIGAPVPLTFVSDPAGITDHKTLLLDGNYYITFSTAGDRDLYIFKTDTQGNRLGGIVPVVLGSSNPTNDMILTTDGASIFVAHARHPGRHLVYELDQNLVVQGPPDTTSLVLAHNNLGGAVHQDARFHLFTGLHFGHGSPLILTRWTGDWQPADPAPIPLVPSVNGEGNFFSTGCAYDPWNGRWYVGFHHLEADQPLDHEHVDLAVFDAGFALIERQHATPAMRFRPHFLLREGHLYLAYDAAGQGVFVHKYRVAGAAGAAGPETPVRPPGALGPSYPNPCTGPGTAIRIPFVPPRTGGARLAIVDGAGRHVRAVTWSTLAPHEMTWIWDGRADTGEPVASGVYFYRFETAGGTWTRRMTLVR